MPAKVHLVKSMVFPVVMYGYKSCTIKKAEHWSIDAFEPVVLEKTLEIPLDFKAIQRVNPKGNQSWIFTGKTNGEFEATILWPPDTENWFPGNYSDARKYWRQEQKRITEDEIVGWHHWLDEHEFEQARNFMMDREAWCAAVHGITKGQARLSDWTELNLINI